jgi:hypothetical protein
MKNAADLQSPEKEKLAKKKQKVGREEENNGFLHLFLNIFPSTHSFIKKQAQRPYGWVSRSTAFTRPPILRVCLLPTAQRKRNSNAPTFGRTNVGCTAVDGKDSCDIHSQLAT